MYHINNDLYKQKSIALIVFSQVQYQAQKLEVILMKIKNQGIHRLKKIYHTLKDRELNQYVSILLVSFFALLVIHSLK